MKWILTSWDFKRFLLFFNPFTQKNGVIMGLEWNSFTGFQDRESAAFKKVGHPPMGGYGTQVGGSPTFLKAANIQPFLSTEEGSALYPGPWVDGLHGALDFLRVRHVSIAHRVTSAIKFSGVTIRPPDTRTEQGQLTLNDVISITSCWWTNPFA